MSKVFGIDLGTTYSCISHIDAFGRPDVIANLDNEPTTPSVVLFDSAEQVVVGKQAKRQARITPDVVATLVKRLMGNNEWRFVAHGKEWSAPAVSGIILRALADDAERSLGEPVENVVITVPAYFGDEERTNTKLAGEYAGLNVVDIINEPTAAAFSYGFATKGAESRTVLVYDLGGGTFDVTAIQLEDRKITVVATDGNHELGGADWDGRVAAHLAERFMAECPGAENPLDDSYGAQDLISAAEDAKQNLSQRESTDVLVVHGGHRANITLQRSEFEQITSTLLHRTIELTRSVLQEAAAKGVETIDQIILVGGSSKMPAVAERLKAEFGFDAQLTDPDLAVAKGAALFGQKKEIEKFIFDDLVARGKLDPTQSASSADSADFQSAVDATAEKYGLPADAIADMVETEIQNVCSRGFGMILQRGGSDELYAHFLTHRNDKLPLVVTDVFNTVIDNQTEVLLQVFEQGGSDESETVADNNILITGSIVGIPPGHPKGTEVHITFSMGADGILDVSGRHAGKQEPLQLRVETGAALSADTIAAERAQVSLIKRKD